MKTMQKCWVISHQHTDTPTFWSTKKSGWSKIRYADVYGEFDRETTELPEDGEFTQLDSAIARVEEHVVNDACDNCDRGDCNDCNYVDPNEHCSDCDRIDPSDPESDWDYCPDCERRDYCSDCAHEFEEAGKK